jgi:integral membrane sensor domain MASE1
MNLDKLVNHMLGLYHQYPIILAGVALILLVIVWKNPKSSFKFALLLVFLAAFFYAVSLFRGTLSVGTQNAHQMINKSKGQAQ